MFQLICGGLKIIVLLCHGCLATVKVVFFWVPQLFQIHQASAEVVNGMGRGHLDR